MKRLTSLLQICLLSFAMIASFGTTAAFAQDSGSAEFETSGAINNDSGMQFLADQLKKSQGQEVAAKDINRCAYAGGACHDGTPCCVGLTCQRGFCKPRGAPGTCTPNNRMCTSDQECCSGNCIGRCTDRR